jgi:TolC family type I secretion outer membrane protein
VIPLAAAAGPAAGQTLSNSMAQAYLTNPTLAAQRASMRATDEQVAQANSQWKPSLSMSTGITTTYTSGTTAATSTNSPSLTVSMSQPLYRGGRIEAGIDVAEANVLGARARLRTTEQTVLASVVEAYMGVLRDQAVLQLNTNSEQVLQGELAAARNRFQLGAATSTDVATAESRLSNASASRIQAEGAFRSSLSNFERIVGVAPSNMTTPEALLLLPNSLEEAIAVALSESPTVLTAFYSEEAAQASLRSANGARLPTVSLSASTSRRPPSWPDWAPPTFTSSIGVSVSVPLYQAGGEFSSIRSARENLSASRLSLEDARRTVRQSVTQSWQGLATARAQILARGDQVRASESALRGFRQEYEVGARTLLEVLNAEQDLLNARVSLVTSRRDEVVASYNLLSAMGRLTAQTLGLAVPIYDPTANYDRVANKWWGLN